jgi:hypothetical protein
MAKDMYKITRDNKEYKADTYTKAKQIFSRLSKLKTPPNVFTRLYCNLGDGYKLMQVHSNRLRKI